MKVEIKEEYLRKAEADLALSDALKDNTKENVKLNNSVWPYVLSYEEEWEL